MASEDELEQAERSLEHVLQELRVIQTGVQILSAFLLTLPFTVRFASTTTFQKSAYGLSLTAAVLTTALVIAPVSYHRRRRAQQGREGLPDVIHVASGLAQAGMATLVVAAAASMLLALDIAAGPVWAIVITTVVVVAYVGLWRVLPAVRRAQF